MEGRGARKLWTCSRAMILAVADRGLNKWPESPPKPITYHSIGGVGRISAGDFAAILPYGLRKIEDVCGARFVWTSNSKTANIVWRAARRGEGGMGRPGGTLADMLVVPAGLRRNDQFQAIGRVDGAEDFHSGEVLDGDGIPITWVIAHEGGHALGLGHEPGNDESDLMGATLGPEVTGFGAWSRREFIRRYPFQTNPLPQPTGPRGDPIRWEVRANGSVHVFLGNDFQLYRNGKIQSIEDSPFQPDEVNG